MFRATPRLIAALVLAVTAGATSLEQLSLDDMIQQSGAIVRARVISSYAAQRGSNFFTFYKLSVTETWKGSFVSGSQVEVAVPGGAVKGVRQAVAGAPSLTNGQEYALFLWTSRSGLTQVIGLSQGLFSLKLDATGTPMATRAAALESIVDRSGRLVEDQPMTLRVNDLRSRVQKKAVQ